MKNDTEDIGRQEQITDQDVIYGLNDLFIKLPKDSPTRKKLSIVANSA